MKNRRAFAGAIAVAGLVAFGFAAAASSSPSRGEVTVALHVDATAGSGGRANVSPPLRSLPTVTTASLGGKAELPPNRTGTLAPQKRSDVSSLAAPNLAPNATLDPVPSPVINVDGLSTANAGALGVPDTNGAAGANHYIQSVNKIFAVYDKTNGTIVPSGGPYAENVLWATGPCSGTGDRGDPIVVYDQLANRWVLSFFAFVGAPSAGGPFYECIAVSQTSDPLGIWWIYDFNLSSIAQVGTSFPDYPKLAVWPDAYYMSANVFPTAGGVDGGMFAFDRVSMINGTSPNPGFLGAVVPALVGNLLPVDLDGSTPPPAGAPGMFVVPDPLQFDMRIYRWNSTNWVGTPSATITSVDIPVSGYDEVVCHASNSQCVDQPGTLVKLDPIDRDQLMFRATYRNFGTHESILTSQTIDVAGAPNPASGVAGVRWYEIRNPRGTPMIYQQGNHGSVESHRWMSSIASDQYGNIALGYNVSNATTVFPGIRYAGRRPTDPLNQMSLTETTLVNGGGSKTVENSDGRARWGDYSAMSVDPVDDCTFWFTGEYLATNVDAFNWKSRIGTFKIFPCPGAPQPPDPIPPPPPVADTTSPNNPVVTSPTHRVGVASRNRQPQIRWSGASDSQSGVDGFSFHLDTSDISTPDRTKDGEENIPGVNYVPLPNGRYFFHIITRDNAGNWTNPRHFGPVVIAVPRSTTGVRCRVPNVRGKTVAQARRQLARANCRLGRTRRVFSNRVRSGRIVKQSRRPGARLARGTRVNVDVSRGRRR